MLTFWSDVPVVVDDTPFLLNDYMSKGLQPGEEELPKDDDEGKSKSVFTPNPEAMSQLLQMGFPENRCIKGLYSTGNSDADGAMTWLFAHMEDPDIDEPLKLDDTSSGPEANPEQIEMLGSMGFTAAQAKKALKETGNSMERAVEWLFSHPDETGEEAPSSSTAPPAYGSQDEMPGTCNLPARFQLDSIVCHKGGSIHAG